MISLSARGSVTFKDLFRRMSSGIDLNSSSAELRPISLSISPRAWGELGIYLIYLYFDTNSNNSKGRRGNKLSHEKAVPCAEDGPKTRASGKTSSSVRARHSMPLRTELEDLRTVRRFSRFLGVDGKKICSLASRYSSYSAADSSASASPLFAIFILIIHPAVYGSPLTDSGASFRPSLTSVTSPPSGVNISETAFTDSTEPKDSCVSNLSPTRGRSTYTTSPSECCA